MKLFKKAAFKRKPIDSLPLLTAPVEHESGNNGTLYLFERRPHMWRLIFQAFYKQGEQDKVVSFDFTDLELDALCKIWREKRG